VKFPLKRGMVFTIEPILCERRSSKSQSSLSNNKKNNKSRNFISDSHKNQNQEEEDEEDDIVENEEENKMDDQVKINILKDGWSAGLYFKKRDILLLFIVIFDELFII